MIRLTAMLRRNPALTPQEFQTHWHDAHAGKIVSVPGVRSVHDRLTVVPHTEEQPCVSP